MEGAVVSWVKGPVVRDEATGDRDMCAGPEPMEASVELLRLELGYAMFIEAGEPVAAFRLM